MITKQELIDEFKFKELPHYTIGGTLVYNVGRNRQISISSIGTPNETLFISESVEEVITDCVCLHNYDYDGYLTKPRLKDLIRFFQSSPYKCS